MVCSIAPTLLEYDVGLLFSEERTPTSIVMVLDPTAHDLDLLLGNRKYRHIG